MPTLGYFSSAPTEASTTIADGTKWQKKKNGSNDRLCEVESYLNGQQFRFKNLCIRKLDLKNLSW